MVFIIFGKPLVFWLGLITLGSFIFQIYLGYRLTHGRSDLFKYHKLNAFVLSCLVLIHLTLGFLLYFNF
jgi:hypothetical protein